MSSPEQEIITEAECDYCGREFWGTGPPADYQLEEHVIMTHPEKVPNWVSGREPEELRLKLRRYAKMVRHGRFGMLWDEIKYDYGPRKIVPGAK